jgi:hypothetical protein
MLPSSRLTRRTRWLGPAIFCHDLGAFPEPRIVENIPVRLPGRRRFHLRSVVAMHPETQLLVEYAPLAVALVCWLFSL